MNLTTMGSTNILRYTGMIHQKGPVFCKKYLDMSPIFHEKILAIGLFFKIFRDLQCKPAQTLKNLKLAKSQEIEPIFRTSPISVSPPPTQYI